jgi:hypothetical protein
MVKRWGVGWNLNRGTVRHGILCPFFYDEALQNRIIKGKLDW